MGKPIELFDWEISTEVPSGPSHLWTVGGNWQPGDIRLHFYAFGADTSGSSGGGNLVVSTPTALTDAVGANSSAPGLAGAICYEILTPTSQDRVGAITGSGGLVLASFFYAAVTLRHAYQIAVLSANTRLIRTIGTGTATSATLSANSTITTPGVEVLFGSAVGAGVQAASGFTQILDSGNSGANYGTGGNDNGLAIQSRTITSGSSMSSTAFTFNGSVMLFIASLFVRQAPDVTVAVGVATTETDTANAATPSILNKVTFPVGTATTEVDTAGQIFSPLTGYRMSNPLVLPGTAVTASKVTWSAQTFAAGSRVIVETSIDNGASWQEATNGGPVPVLAPGNTNAANVLSRVTLVRAALTDPSPRVFSLEVDVSCESATEEYVSLGMFLVQETEITVTGGTSGTGAQTSGGGDGVTGSGGGATGGGKSLQVSGADLSWAVARNTWGDVFYVPYGTTYSDAIMMIIRDRMPTATFNFVSTEQTTPQLIYGGEQGNDPWQDALDLAAAIGFELFFDANGVCTLRPVPDPTTGSPVWEFDDGMSPTVVNVVRNYNEQTTFNYIIVTGESSSGDAPVSAVAFDNDPKSATYVGGDYGVKSYMWQSSEITTVAQAQAAADALLFRALGASDTTVLTNVPMPALEPGDIVAVNVAEAGAAGNYLLNSINTPLSPSEGQESTVYRQTTN